MALTSFEETTVDLEILTLLGMSVSVERLRSF